MSINDRISYFIDYQFNGNQKRFAESINFSPQVIYNIVSGRKSKPSFEVLEAIASTFVDLNADWLLTGKGEMVEGKKKTTNIYSSFFEQKQVLHNLTKAYEDQIELLKEINEERKKTIIFLETEIKKLQNEIDQLKKEQPSPADHTKPTHSEQ